MNEIIRVPPETGDPNQGPLPPPLRWGRGSLQTWVWIAAMCVLGLAIALGAFVLPMGRTADVPQIQLY